MTVSQPQAPQKKRSWPIYIITVLLLGQALIGVYLGTRVWQDRTWDLSRDWFMLTAYISTWWGQAPAVNVPATGAVSTLEFLLLLPLAPIIVINAFGFFLLRPLGWLAAMMMQGLILAICLNQYLQTEKFFIYPMMLYAILMVLYLNAFHVRVIFLTPVPIHNLDNQDGS